jgi:hypothetical protein
MAAAIGTDSRYGSGMQGDIAEVTNIGTDIIAGGAAIAGLLLVFVGNSVAEYRDFDAEASDLVRWRYRKVAWFGFGGFLLSLASVALALIAKLWFLTEARAECPLRSARALVARHG